MSSDLTPEQIFEFYNARLTELLTQHNPEGLATIGVLLKQFPGKEHQVYTQICKKCGANPVAKPTQADFKDGKVKPLKPKDGRVAVWLNERLFERYANKAQFQTMSWKDFISISAKGRLIELGVLPNDATLLISAIAKERGDSDMSDQKVSNKADFEVGENCYTKLLTSAKDGEKWLNARITNINDDTYDIFVYNSKAFNVPPEAVNVPREMLKKRSENVQIAIPDPKRKSGKRPQFQMGDRVRVFNLRSHTSYNGLCGTVLLYVPSERRYQVRLDTNDVIAIKQRNVTGAGDADNTRSPVQSEKRKSKDRGLVEKDDETMLSELMSKLMQDNPNTDPGKLGEFAAGYILAKKKMSSNKDN